MKRYDLVGDMDGNCSLNEARMELSEDGIYVRYREVRELEAENQKLREQRDAANAQIQMLNSIIAGDV